MRRLSLILTNRVTLGLILFFILIGVWEFKWKPQYRPLYQDGVKLYQDARYREALEVMNKAYDIAPNSVDVIMMQGWINLKLKRYEEARLYFGRVLRIDPRVEEAQLGQAFVTLETGKGQLDYRIVMKYLGNRFGDPNVAIVAAGAMRKEGRNPEAADIYYRLRDDKNYGEAARLALSDMLGLEGYNGAFTWELDKAAKPDNLQVRFRAGDGSMWRMGRAGWEKYYVTGVNLGPGAPNYYPAYPPKSVPSYLDWIQKAEGMNANTLRVYTLLPPAFYRAFKQHRDAGGKISLYQQIWIGDPPNKDLFDRKFYEETQAEIRYVVDALHGHGNVPPKHARGDGLYTFDLSANVGAILLGRELEASTAIQTNIINGGKRSFDGKYFSIQDANATEVWFAEMLDYLVTYETATYNWQHPVAIVNWPPTDPLDHPTETPNFDEVKFRIRHGEQLELPKNIDDDNDSVAIDEAKYKVKPELAAGLFASYHVYPYYPDFLLLDKGYLKARDSEGPNPMAGYLKELKAHIPYPLLITEYGMPNAIGISHFHPYGWHHGGHGEAEQADIVRRESRAVKEAGCAGGIVFSLIDEWYKHNWLTVDFEDPIERATLWLNELDPEKRYGMLGWRTSKWDLFGDGAKWAGEPVIYQGAAKGEALQSVQAATDEAFLYLRLNGACVGCGKDKRAYAVALNPLPNQAGVRKLPFGVTMTQGATFLLYLSSPDFARLYIAENYNPYQIKPRPNLPNETELSYKRAFVAKLADSGDFQEQVVETNRRRFGRDGTLYPAQRYSRSVLRYAATEADRKDSLAEWYTDPKGKFTVVRIPWGKLMITDPSSKRVFQVITTTNELRSTATPGVDIAVFELQEKGSPGQLGAVTVLGSFPKVQGGNIAQPVRITWKTWEKVEPAEYEKKVYEVMSKEFLEQSREQK
ncbi:MAG: hypothetical protein HYX26_10160 [Acidobacteriales bacterium]|nr:hypothetical protein [Terriglobales bacterium]